MGADDMAVTTSAFDLPERLAPKADPALIARDEEHFAAIAESLEQTIADLSDRLETAQKGSGGVGDQAFDWEPRRCGPAGAGPGPGSRPADDPAAAHASLRPGPVPRTRRQR